MKQFFVIGLVVLIIDQATKFIVNNWMELGQTIPIIPGIFHLTYIRNPGAAFGILVGQRYFFVFVTLFVLALLIWYVRQVRDNQLLRIAFGLQLGGAVGNLIDRLIHVEVIDFLDFRVWPIFNVADIAIVVGVGLFALDMFLEWKESKNEA